MGIGSYWIPIVFLPRVLATAGASGQKVPTWPMPETPKTWYASQEKPQAAEAIAAGLRQSVSSCRLRVRGWPEVAATDRIYRKDREETLSIVGIFAEGFDTVFICDAVKA